jgi:hypothetical protein
MCLALAVVLTAAGGAATALAAESVKSCIYQAKVDYNRAYLSLLQRGPKTSLQDLIAQRRVFCFRFAQCSLNDVNSSRFRGAFDRCLKAEPPEKYNAKPCN